MVLFDSVGLSLFVPLLQIGDSGAVTPNDKLTRFTVDVFEFFGLPFSTLSLLLIIALVFLLKSFVVYFGLQYYKRTLRLMTRDIRVELALAVQNLSFKEFTLTDVGRMQNSLLGEAQVVVSACSSYLDAIKHGMIIGVYVTFAFWLDWRFSLLIVSGGIVTNFAYRGFYSKTQELSRKITRNNHVFGGLVVELVNHFKYLKATGRNEKFIRNMVAELEKLTKRQIEIGRLGALLSAIREPMLVIVICAAISVHVMLVGASLSSMMIVLILYYRALGYIISMQAAWNNYLASSGTLENIIDYKKYLKQHQILPVQGRNIDEVKSISVSNLSLQYGDFRVLDDISISISKNESIAFVGESGSGKTTLVNVLAGLIPASHGNVYINGIPLEECDTSTYNARIGYVSQEPTIFNADFFDNVSFWAERTEENLNKFWQVVEMCSIKSFIESVPNRESAMLGNNGLNISGGQKQRISIARELYRDIDVLFLDEATAALDSETEKEIRDSIQSLQGKLTIVSIAHRLSTIMSADKIYLMEKGRVVAHGRFDELKEKSEYFAKISQLQGL